MQIHGSSPISGVNRNLDQATKQVEGQLAKLSSGMRVNSAADDASGLSMSERMRALIESLEETDRNATAGIRLVETAETDLGQISEVLGRMRELGVQSANGTLSDADRANLDAEFTQLRDEVDRIAVNSEYNGTTLLASDTESIYVQVGLGDGERIEVELDGMTAEDLGLDVARVAAADQAAASVAIVDEAIDAVSKSRSSLGATRDQLASAVESIRQSRESLVATESGIRDADLAYETAQLVQSQILQHGAMSVLSQANVSNERAQQLLG